MMANGSGSTGGQACFSNNNTALDNSLAKNNWANDVL